MKYPIIVLISALLFGCSDGRIKPTKEDVAEFQAILAKAVAEQKTTTQNEPIASEERKHVTEAREIIEIFWNPKNLERYGELQWGYDLYDKEYLIAQTEVDVAIRMTTEWPTNLEYSIGTYEPFNPRRPKENEWTFYSITNLTTSITIPDSQVLHLTPNMKERLENFLGSDFTEFGTPNIMNPAQAKDRSAQRLAAADTFLTIIPDHWGEGWHFISHPEIFQILFNKELDKAIVAFRIGYEGGYADLQKEDDNWKLTTSFMYWVE